MAKQAPKHFFSQNPSVNSQRTLFDMSKTDTRTLNPDYYYPDYKLLIIPGDTVVMDYSNVIRMLDPLQVPMMDNLYCDVHFWFVAFDNIWDYTKNFFGEKKRPSDPDIQTVPLIKFTSDTLPTVGSVYDYFNIPVVGTDGLLSGSFDINALPLMAYYLIHDEWIRDEQRQDYLLDTPDFKATTFTPDKFTLYKRGKRFDYFTSTLLNPQVGEPVAIGLGGSAPVISSTISNNLSGYINNPDKPLSLHPITYQYRNIDYPHDSVDIRTNRYLAVVPVAQESSSEMIGSLSTSINVSNIDTTKGAFPLNLRADLSSASSLSVEQLRRAFQVQAYNEIMARYGTRYTEYLYSMYGVVNPDQLLERPEYLGGTHQRLSVQPIVQNSQTTSDSALGDLGGIVTGSVAQPVFTRSFTRFGYIIGCINIYADLTYYQGLEKDWQIKDRMDLPLNIFANLTDQPVYKSEIVLTGTSSDEEVFGYQEIYSWAKYAQNTLAGLVRPNVSQSVGYWSLAEKFDTVPVNDDTFIEMKTPINRITGITDNDNPNIQHFIVNQKFDVKLTRELPMHSDPMKWMFRY